MLRPTYEKMLANGYASGELTSAPLPALVCPMVDATDQEREYKCTAPSTPPSPPPPYTAPPPGTSAWSCDNDRGLASLAAANGYPQVTSCAAAQSSCTAAGEIGDAVRSLCKGTCTGAC